jgi:hypothetical protein
VWCFFIGRTLTGASHHALRGSMHRNPHETACNGERETLFEKSFRTPLA